jgi:hypothetical protein
LCFQVEPCIPRSTMLIVCIWTHAHSNYKCASTNLFCEARSEQGAIRSSYYINKEAQTKSRHGHCRTTTP